MQAVKQRRAFRKNSSKPPQELRIVTVSSKGRSRCQPSRELWTVFWRWKVLWLAFAAIGVVNVALNDNLFELLAVLIPFWMSNSRNLDLSLSPWTFAETNVASVVHAVGTRGGGAAAASAKVSLDYTRYSVDPPPQMHPWAGALDEDQQWGYVHNPRILHEQQLTLLHQISGEETSEICSEKPVPELEGEDGYLLLTQKITVANGNYMSTTTNAKTRSEQHQQPPRIFCIVYTFEGAESNVQAIAETWGKRCDGFLAASTYTDRSTATVHLPHFGAEGTYDSIWQKVRSTVAYVYTNFRRDFDYFHICGDDTYLIVDNLRHFVAQEGVHNATQHHIPVYAGEILFSYWRTPLQGRIRFYNGGGSGYTLNRAALELLAERGLPQCSADRDDPFEDLYVGECFREMGVLPRETFDDVTGAGRYHHADPQRLLHWTPVWSLHRFLNGIQRRWRQMYLGEPVDRWQAVSDSSIVFHWIKTPTYMRRMDRLLYPAGPIATQYCRQQEMEA